MIVVADRGMVTKASLALLRATVGAGWITALKAPQLKQLVKQGQLQLAQGAEARVGTLKGPLELRPIHHRLEDPRQRMSFLGMFAYYLAGDLRKACKPAALGRRGAARAPDPVAKASRSRSAQRKARTKRTTAGEPCHSLSTLLAELSTQCRNRGPGTTSPGSRSPRFCEAPHCRF